MSEITKQALVSAFGAVLAKKPFGKITIRDLTDECGLNRMTFYYHFKDIYDLIQWMIENRVKRLLADSADITWKEQYRRILEFAIEKKSVIVRILAGIEHQYIRACLKNLAADISRQAITEILGDTPILEEDLSFLARLYAGVLVEVLLDWVSGGMRESTELTVARVALVLDGTAQRAAEGFAEMRKNP